MKKAMFSIFYVHVSFSIFCWKSFKKIIFKINFVYMQSEISTNIFDIRQVLIINSTMTDVNHDVCYCICFMKYLRNQSQSKRHFETKVYLRFRNIKIYFGRSLWMVVLCSCAITTWITNIMLCLINIEHNWCFVNRVLPTNKLNFRIYILDV